MTTAVEDLRDPASNGVVFPDATDAQPIEAAGRELGFAVYRIAVAAGKQSMLEALASALRFPPHFGHNWDALADCLSDLSWIDATGYVLIFDTGNDWSTTLRDDLEMLVEICSEAAASWADRDVPFHVAVVIPPESRPW